MTERKWGQEKEKKTLRYIFAKFTTGSKTEVIKDKFVLVVIRQIFYKRYSPNYYLIGGLFKLIQEHTAPVHDNEFWSLIFFQTTWPVDIFSEPNDKETRAMHINNYPLQWWKIKAMHLSTEREEFWGPEHGCRSVLMSRGKNNAK